jgi:glycosyltransferase involved in cell wall biosynthesis
VKKPLSIDVLVIIGSLDVGGTEKHLLNVIPRLSQQGLQIAIATFMQPGKLAPLFAKEGICIFSPNIPKWVEQITPITMCLKALWLGKLIASLQPTAVHSFLPAAYLLGNTWAVLLQVPVRIMSRRSLNHYQQRHPLLSRLEYSLHRKTHLLIGNSNAIVEQLKSETGKRADRVQLIRNGIDTKPFFQTKPVTQVRFELAIPEKALLITKVANYIPYKGHSDLLEALHLIVNKLPKEWRLICVGRDDGPLPILRIKAQHLGLSNHILWLDSRSAIPDLLCASDIGVLASHEEGSSNAILECMAASLPMVATNVGGNPELVENGLTGLTVPPKAPLQLSDALLRLAKDAKLRQSMGAAGSKRVEKLFSIESCVKNYQRTYDLLLKTTT